MHCPLVSEGAKHVSCEKTVLHRRMLMAQEHEKLVRNSVSLEEEVLDAIEKTSRELERDTGRKWSRAAVIRLALSDFFTRRGMIV